MPNSQQNVTNIPSNRVDFIDKRTGLVSREWYRFFVNLFNLAGAGGNQVSLDDLQVGPPPQPTTTSGGGGGSGTVTSVDVSGGTTGLTTTGGPITSAGTITLGGTLNVANGGTGATTAAGAPFALKGANADITSMSGITGAVGSPTSIQMGNGSGTTLAAGKMWYDQTNGSWNMGMGGGNITQQVGEEQFIYGKASAAITEGQLVCKTGTVGASGVITFGPSPTGLTTNDGIIGVATENIALNGFGRITQFGVVHGINTTGASVGETWVDNDTLYYNPNYAGGMTNVKPTAPNIKFEIATVINAGSGGSGSIQVLLQPGSTLGGTDSNVQFGTLANNDLIAYDSGLGYWKNIPGSSYGTGSVTSVGTSGSVNGLTLTGGPITTSGTITLGGTLDLSSPPTIGNTTPNTGKFTTLTATSTSQFGTGSANYQQLVGAATTLAPVLSVAGSDTNVALAIKTQGTGAIDLAAGSRGVNISNGGTVTAITRTAAGGSYTSAPTVTISAPTTAGGVQATATCTLGVNTAAISSGGTGYTAGDVLTVSGGTFTTATQITVSTVSAGVITAVTISTAGVYTVMPSNPVSVTGGTGSGATFTLGAVVNSTYTITNAGSGYVEQPTVSFSGGGGSGAAAYASVGSNTTIRNLGGVVNFSTPGGIAFSVADTNRTTVDYWQAVGSSGTVGLKVEGSTANNNGIISSKGTGYLSFNTNAFAQEQLRVSHTASAVNYVQVTGAATTQPTVISAQGSDSNINLNLRSKGAYYVSIQDSTAKTIADFKPVANSVNQFGFAPAVTGSAPVISVAGTDTNIDLALTPKGTGRVKFGTYTANMALTVQGYIEILDSGGTVRKLAVIA